jgi:hypothetical protein
MHQLYMSTKHIMYCNNAEFKFCYKERIARRLVEYMNMNIVEIRNNIKKMKILLWKIGLIRNCPKCNGNLRQVGHPVEVGWINYICTSEKCDFGKRNQE